jgi:hypothetical protein
MLKTTRRIRCVILYQSEWNVDMNRSFSNEVPEIWRTLTDGQEREKIDTLRYLNDWGLDLNAGVTLCVSLWDCNTYCTY